MKSPKETIRFNAKNVVETLDRLKTLAELKFGASAGRRDFYEYLGEVYRWVMAWNAANRTNRLRDHVATKMGREGPRSNADAFHLVIEATCPKPKQAISKFAIALSNAEKICVQPKRFETFLAEIGGPTTIYTRKSIFAITRRVREAKEEKKKARLKKARERKK